MTGITRGPGAVGDRQDAPFLRRFGEFDKEFVVAKRADMRVRASPTTRRENEEISCSSGFAYLVRLVAVRRVFVVRPIFPKTPRIGVDYERN